MSQLLIAQITDTHLFAQEEQTLLGLPTSQSLTAVLSRLNDLPTRPDLLLLTGDLSQDETLESYQRLYRLVAPLGIPTYWVPGNHDVFPQIEQGLQAAPFFPDKAFHRGGWNFVLLNSRVSRKVYGFVPSEQLAWMEQQLQTLGDHPTLIALHHPPSPIGSEWMDDISLKNSTALLEVMDRYPQIKLVLFGHIHQEFDAWRQGVRYLGTPSTCVQFKPNSSTFALDELKPGFRLLHLEVNGTFETKVERVNCVHQLDFAATGY